MIATGSIEGTPYCTSLVATAFTQSVDPGIGTSSTLMPAFAYQPILAAIAYGAAADDTVLAHHATRTLVCACAKPALAASAIVDSRMVVFLIRILPLTPRQLPFWRLRRRTSATHPRTARGAARRSRYR